MRVRCAKHIVKQGFTEETVLLDSRSCFECLEENSYTSLCRKHALEGRGKSFHKVMLDEKKCLVCTAKRIMEEHRNTFEALAEQEAKDLAKDADYISKNAGLPDTFIIDGKLYKREDKK